MNNVKQTQFEIYNLQGELISSSQFNLVPGNNTIQFTESTGIYVVRLKCENQIQTAKISIL
ncbi:MAG: T9SS type A sorting domain-containing protein [Crocinitomicaceae bacterium]|nr:T9SS type A sorting domain-containing protein [Crocinitomicaceae bacterium]